MSVIRSLGTLGLVALAAAACQPYQSNSPLPYTTGTVQEQLRQIQLQNARSGANPGVQNPPVVDVNPGTTGIVRAPAGGEGNFTAGAPMSVNPGTTGIVRQPGVGAPMR
jgi:hypothetical protein